MASYDGTLTFPAATASYDTAVAPLGITRIVDPSVAGVVRFAASLTSGIPAGPILVVRLHLLRPGFLPPLGLTFANMKTVKGASAAPRLWVQGRAPVRIEAQRPGGKVRLGKPIVDSTPHLESLNRHSVGSTQLSSGAVVTVTIFGRNFDRTGNLLMFGPLSFPNQRSPDRTTIKFVVPATMESRSGGPPMALTPSVYPISVRNSHGTSNSLNFRIMP